MTKEERAAAYYAEHGWSGCAGSRWEVLTEATRDGWRHAARAKGDAWEECLDAVVAGVRGAKRAHADLGHRAIVSALVGLELAIPRTENPYR